MSCIQAICCGAAAEPGSLAQLCFKTCCDGDWEVCCALLFVSTSPPALDICGSAGGSPAYSMPADYVTDVQCGCCLLKRYIHHIAMHPVASQELQYPLRVRTSPQRGQQVQAHSVKAGQEKTHRLFDAGGLVWHPCDMSM